MLYTGIYWLYFPRYYLCLKANIHHETCIYIYILYIYTHTDLLNTKYSVLVQAHMAEQKPAALSCLTCIIYQTILEYCSELSDSKRNSIHIVSTFLSWPSWTGLKFDLETQPFIQKLRFRSSTFRNYFWSYSETTLQKLNVEFRFRFCRNSPTICRMQKLCGRIQKP